MARKKSLEESSYGMMQSYFGGTPLFHSIMQSSTLQPKKKTGLSYFERMAKVKEIIGQAVSSSDASSCCRLCAEELEKKIAEEVSLQRSDLQQYETYYKSISDRQTQLDTFDHQLLLVDEEIARCRAQELSNRAKIKALDNRLGKYADFEAKNRDTVPYKEYDEDRLSSLLCEAVEAWEGMASESMCLARPLKLYPLYDLPAVANAGSAHSYIVVNNSRLSFASIASEQLHYQEMNAGYVKLACMLLSSSSLISLYNASKLRKEGGSSSEEGCFKLGDYQWRVLPCIDRVLIFLHVKDDANNGNSYDKNSGTLSDTSNTIIFTAKSEGDKELLDKNQAGSNHDRIIFSEANRLVLEAGLVIPKRSESRNTSNVNSKLLCGNASNGRSKTGYEYNASPNNRASKQKARSATAAGDLGQEHYSRSVLALCTSLMINSLRALPLRNSPSTIVSNKSHGNSNWLSVSLDFLPLTTSPQQKHLLSLLLDLFHSGSISRSDVSSFDYEVTLQLALSVVLELVIGFEHALYYSMALEDCDEESYVVMSSNEQQILFTDHIEDSERNGQVVKGMYERLLDNVQRKGSALGNCLHNAERMQALLVGCVRVFSAIFF